jgi:hypothetical protein
MFGFFFWAVFIGESLIPFFISFSSLFLFSSFVACSQSVARRVRAVLATLSMQRVLTPIPDFATALTAWI